MAVESVERRGIRWLRWCGAAAFVGVELSFLWLGVRDGSVEAFGVVLLGLVVAATTTRDASLGFAIADGEIEARRWLWPHRVVGAADVLRLVEDLPGGVVRIDLRSGRPIPVRLSLMANGPEVRAALQAWAQRQGIPFEPSRALVAP